MIGTVEERFLAKVEKTDGCWIWTGALGTKGYGEFQALGHRQAHLVSYELYISPVPERMQVDHLCHGEAVKLGLCDGGVTCVHRKCVNPSHLEAVPGFINRNRGNGRSKSGFIGVYWRPKASTWEAWVRCGGKTRYIGSFDTSEEAAFARDEIATMLWGKEALLNFPR